MLSRGAKRVPIIDTGIGSIVTVISQSDIVFFLHRHPEILGSRIDVSVVDSGLISNPVVSITSRSSLLDALRTLNDHRLTGVPVVGEDSGQVLAFLSAQDLRALLRDQPRGLTVMDSIMSWVEAVKGSQTDSIFASALRFNISKLEDFTCHVTDSLG